MKKGIAWMGLWVIFFSCADNDMTPSEVPVHDSEMVTVNMDTILSKPVKGNRIDAKSVSRNDIVDYAKTLVGVPYKYASTNPSEGFDCSGFITNVFNHFNVQVPRSSVDFTNVNKEVQLAIARPGDLILFTGTDSTIRIVGHMGIVVENTDTLKFIHSTSGKQYGVTITPLNSYYMGRFVKVVDIF